MRCCEAVELRHKCVEEASLEGKEVKNTIVITFAFQIVFTAFHALQSLHSSLHDEESLGNIALAILYGTAVVSSIFSPTIIGLIGAKSAIVAAFAAHCIYVLANFYPSFATMAPTAVALGAFHGPAWTSQALYISASAFSFSKSSSASPYAILSRFNGFFFAVFATAQIVGHLVTSTVIRDGVGNSTEEMSYKYCGSLDCPHENATIIEDPEEWVIDITLGFYMACTLLGLFLVVFLLAPLPRSDWIQRVNVRSTITSCFWVLMSTNMLLLVPFIFFTAAEHAFLLSAYTKSYIACPIGIHMVGYVMAVYGVTTPVFVYIFSRLARIAGRFLLLMLSLITHIILFIVLFHFSPTADDTAVIFIIPMVWGVAESILQAQANALIAMLFPSQKEPAFANFHAWRSLGYAITFVNASYMCISTKLIVCMTFASVGTVLYMCVELKEKIRQKLAFKRARPSIVSTQSENTIKEKSIHEMVPAMGPSVSPLNSIQDHLSFDRVELTDIIMEAQQGWRRDEKGLTLELSKVMSLEHLAGSKATTWYHTRPVASDHVNPSPRTRKANKSKLPRSLSDGHLHYAAAKVDAALVSMKRGRDPTRRRRGQGQAEHLVKTRHVSEIPSSRFDVIQEDADEDQFRIENELGTSFSQIQNKDDNVFDHIEDDINEEEEKEIMQYRKLIRRLSETLIKDNIVSHEAEADAETYYQDSLSSGSHDNEAPETDDNDPYLNGDIVFTGGSTSPSGLGWSNKAFESDDTETQNGEVAPCSNGTRSPNTSKAHRPIRLISHDHGYLSENSDDYGPPSDGFKKQVKIKLSQESSNTDNTKKTKRKKFRMFKSLQKSKRPGNGDISSVNISSNASTGEQICDEDDNEDCSDADSDGFVDEKLDDNVNNITTDFIDIEKPKRKGLIPICETEDITCIY